MPRNTAVTPGHFTQFGELLQYLRRRAGLTQRELSIAVGYSDSQISRLEHNQRVPDQNTLNALFLPALDILEEPEWATRLLELAAQARQVEASALETKNIPIPPNNLPHQLTSFLGRRSEIAEIVRLLSPGIDKAGSGPEVRSRSVTLTGPGGVGKTRLAIQAAIKLMEVFPDGVWMVDFAPLADPALVPQTVAAILSLREEGGQSMRENLISHLRPKTSLLLLDNCEHLIDACANLAVGVLQACPNVCILATSREALGIAGEIPFLIAPLSVPDLYHSLPIEKLIEHDGVRLFIERARTTLPSFTLTADNASAVGDLCHRLDGLPLAIELAAARVNVMSVAQITERLADSFHFLGRGARTAPLRSQTLQACMDWSYNLLSDSERLFLNRLAVFVGGWTLEAAEGVCTDEAIRLPDAVNLLAQLVEKSLVVVDHRPDGLRYRFLDTVHQHALTKLTLSGESEAVRDRHLVYYLEMIETREHIFHFRDRIGWMNQVEADYNNLRAALEWSLTEGVHSSLCYRLAKQLGVFWEWRGFFDEGRDWFLKVLARPVATHFSLERAELLFVYAWLAIYQSDIQAGRLLLEECQAIYEKFRPMGMRGETEVLNSLAAIENDSGEARIALEHAQKALEIADKIGYLKGVSFAHHMMGVSLGRLGEYEPAWLHLETSLSINSRIGRSSINLLVNLGELAIRQGNYEKGEDYLEQCLRQANEAKDTWSAGASLGSLGWNALCQGEVDRARRLLGESLAVRQEIGDKGGIAWCLEKLAGSAASQGKPEKAARILGKAASLRLTVNSPVNSADKPDYDQLLSSLHERIEPEAFQSAWEAGSTMPLSEAIDLALQA